MTRRWSDLITWRAENDRHPAGMQQYCIYMKFILSFELCPGQGMRLAGRHVGKASQSSQYNGPLWNRPSLVSRNYWSCKRAFFLTVDIWPRTRTDKAAGRVRG